MLFHLVLQNTARRGNITSISSLGLPIMLFFIPFLLVIQYLCLMGDLDFVF